MRAVEISSATRTSFPDKNRKGYRAAVAVSLQNRLQMAAVAPFFWLSMAPRPIVRVRNVHKIDIDIKSRRKLTIGAAATGQARPQACPALNRGAAPGPGYA
jgi:hypothetical protein